MSASSSSSRGGRSGQARGGGNGERKRGGRGNGSGNDGKRGGGCFNCHQPGHRRSECPNGAAGSGSGRGTQNRHVASGNRNGNNHHHHRNGNGNGGRSNGSNGNDGSGERKERKERAYRPFESKKEATGWLMNRLTEGRSLCDGSITPWPATAKTPTPPTPTSWVQGLSQSNPQFMDLGSRPDFRQELMHHLLSLLSLPLLIDADTTAHRSAANEILVSNSSIITRDAFLYLLSLTPGLSTTTERLRSFITVLNHLMKKIPTNVGPTLGMYDQKLSELAKAIGDREIIALSQQFSRHCQAFVAAANAPVCESKEVDLAAAGNVKLASNQSLNTIH
jgi:hypothetical protein